LLKDQDKKISEEEKRIKDLEDKKKVDEKIAKAMAKERRKFEREWDKKASGLLKSIRNKYLKE